MVRSSPTAATRSLLLVLLLATLSYVVRAAPFQHLRPRDYPYFPDDIPSCPVCEASWGSIRDCAAPSSNFRNVSSIFLDPFAFVSLVTCACGTTFSSAYPQCVDCFIQTGQCEKFLDVPDAHGASEVEQGLRDGCAFLSAVLGGVATSQGANYTYTTGVPNQETTSVRYGPGYEDQGAAQTTTSAASELRQQQRAATSLLLSLFTLAIAASVLSI